ncbi:sensor histidine kinase [Flavobacterium aquidurense]|uniref:histidine kinase n=1 Tax=Flavobacterium aquidurense TaxID=362413 RepID=A0A0Q0XRM4_9FLAO|nr:ATP-binding protein [Flavobacterium aquidurense]KQB38627.1 Bacteriophytochrome (Light-regulated signal transduction histidine kinase) [Flavobacterium aquidurense]
MSKKKFTLPDTDTLPEHNNKNHKDELWLVNKRLALQIEDRKKRAAELVIANKELAYQNQEKEKRAAELVIANTELAYQNQEKEKRAAELVIANTELTYQNKEKEKRAAELVIANAELTYQNNEKEKRAAELAIANAELAFQNEEKEKRAAELFIANAELTFQNNEKEKRAAELLLANNELQAFTYISSHHLQEPLRKIQVFSNRITTDEYQNLTDKGKHYFERIEVAAFHMQALINDLLTYSRTNVTEKKFENTKLNDIIDKVLEDLKEEITAKKAIIEIFGNCTAFIIPSQFHQLICNLVSNSLKFSTTEKTPHITIESIYTKPKTKKNQSFTNYCHITINDNGIGFEPQFETRVFEMFQQLNNKKDYKGTGIGLAIVKKIVENHNGMITATGKPGLGAKFDIYIPVV